MAVANHLLVGQQDYGESHEELEKNWEIWTHHIPFDAPVAEALAKMYAQRLEKLDRKKDAAVYQRIERKLTLARKRAARYRIAPSSGAQG